MRLHPVRTYLLQTFGWSWLVLLTLYTAHRLGWLSYASLQLGYNLGAAGPALGAVLAARRHYGAAGLRALGRRLGPMPWSGVVRGLVLAPLVLLGAGLLSYPLATGQVFRFAVTQAQFHLGTPLSYLLWALPLLSYAVLEEIGWRGFLLPHLQQHHSALTSTVLLTGIWGCWHAPMFLYRLQFSPWMTVGFFLSLLVGALLLTAVFNASGGSVLACAAFHLANNAASAFDQEYVVVVVGAGYVLLAAGLLGRYGPAALAPGARIGNYLRHPAAVLASAASRVRR
ncbi:CPBP family intramembrane metalloprotease [Hymenobacter sp. 15J16-1T3B]|uniref:CPBP family intramembrane glutamic endopeptidase n=1 Tax=Hymenobacter sp. 15J16-1T3B TaxID=2886941 RepID=UPI001D0FF966|nr:CPBP family intramembrane glutamic endopeptidase [Hymenobacter sp. 15J16-1T3B]MCC3156684.1 CPBP family intramembrane metalloprotease [Hymenobacter sp. 15J16-1T3B]